MLCLILCQRGYDTVSRYLVKHYSRCFSEEIFEVGLILNHYTLGKSDNAPYGGWATSNQLKTVKEKTKSPKGRRNFASEPVFEHKLKFFPGSSAYQPTLQILPLLP